MSQHDLLFADSQLMESERRFRYAALATRDVIWDWSVDRDELWVNDALRSEWGHAFEGNRLDAQWWSSHIHRDDVDRVIRSLEAAMGSVAEHWTGEYRFHRGDQSFGFACDRRVIIRDHDGRAVRVVGAMQDVTRQKLSELRTAEAEGLARIGHFSHDFIRGTSEYSTEMGRIAGLGAGETIIGPKALSRVHPDDRDLVFKGLPRFEVRMLDDQGRVRFLQARVAYEFLEDGTLARAFGTVQDVTDRVEAEETRSLLERQLEQARRVSSLGRVAATLAHEFNNVLMGIQPFAEVIRRRSSDERVLEAANQILASVNRGRRLTHDILRTTQVGEPDLAPVDVSALIGHLEAELSALVAPNVALRVQLAPEPLVAMCDAAQIQQVVTNLATNARDAMPNGGELLISVERVLREGKKTVGITVSDTGVGIPPAVLPSIFEPLFTTKRTGTGLGLAVVQQLINRNGGSIAVASEEGTGTTFALLLPAILPVAAVL